MNDDGMGDIEFQSCPDNITLTKWFYMLGVFLSLKHISNSLNIDIQTQKSYDSRADTDMWTSHDAGCFLWEFWINDWTFGQLDTSHHFLVFIHV